ncbi:hypothetical protein [Lysobacter gummosus]
MPCRGTGEVCNEYSDDSGRWAVFELCAQCGGEGLSMRRKTRNSSD